MVSYIFSVSVDIFSCHFCFVYFLFSCFILIWLVIFPLLFDLIFCKNWHSEIQSSLGICVKLAPGPHRYMVQYLHRTYGFKSSLNNLWYLIQCKCYINGCYTVLFREQWQEKISLFMFSRDEILGVIWSWGWWSDSSVRAPTTYKCKDLSSNPSAEKKLVVCVENIFNPRLVKSENAYPMDMEHWLYHTWCFLFFFLIFGSFIPHVSFLLLPYSYQL
jgi:hypothetical protein